MANEFKAKNGLISIGNIYVTGSIISSLGFSGSHFGTSSYSVTSSYTTFNFQTPLTTGSLLPITSSQAVSSSYSFSSSYANNSGTSATASFALNVGAPGTILTTGSIYIITSSWATSAVNSSLIATASTSNWYLTFASSSTGGNLGESVTSSLSVIPGAGSLSATSLTGSLSGTSSQAVSSSYGLSSSFASSYPKELATGSTYTITSSWAISCNSSSVISTAGNTLYYFDLSSGSSGIQPTYVDATVTLNPSTNQISGSGLGLTGSLLGTASTSSFALTSSLIKSWGFVTYNIGIGTTGSFYNATVTRTALGTFPVLFTNPLSTANYAVTTTGWSGSNNSAAPTASYLMPVKQTTTGFTMSVVKLSAAVPPVADFNTASFYVFSY